jgi:hypothetical protein
LTVNGTGSAGSTPPLQRIIWVAVMMGLVAYVVLGVTGVVAPVNAVPPAGGALLWVFTATAPTLAVVAWWFHARAAAAGASNESAGAGMPSTANAQAALTLRVVGWALQEAIGILGFVLMMLGHRPLEWLPFCGVALGLLLVSGPRAESA